MIFLPGALIEQLPEMPFLQEALTTASDNTCLTGSRQQLPATFFLQEAMTIASGLMLFLQEALAIASSNAFFHRKL
jgi:hypothetical protein